MSTSDNTNKPATATVCALPTEVDLSQLTLVELQPESPLADYQVAIQLANDEAEKHLGEAMLLSWYDRDNNDEAEKHLGEAMLLSWYDRDRDFESPQHASECHQDSATPGYVDYGIHHGATLKIDIEQGRFVFFYLPVTL